MDRYKASSLAAYNGPAADRYDESPAVRLLDLTTLDDFVLDVVGDAVADVAVLDVGCGTGRLLARLWDAGATRLAGSDLATRMLELTRERLSKVDAEADLRQGDAEGGLPWSSNAFDAVVSTGAFHHFFRPDAALLEMGRVLRPGGRLIVADPCFFTPLRGVLNLMLRVHPREGDFRFYSMREAGEVFTANGWRMERCERLNWWAFGVVARPGL